MTLAKRANTEYNCIVVLDDRKILVDEIFPFNTCYKWITEQGLSTSKRITLLNVDTGVHVRPIGYTETLNLFFGKDA